MSFKIALLALLFVATAGSFFEQRFRKNRLLAAIALTVSLASTFYLYRSIVSDVENSTREVLDERSFENESLSKRLSELEETLSPPADSVEMPAEPEAETEREAMQKRIDELEAAYSKTEQLLRLDREPVIDEKIAHLANIRTGDTRELLLARVGPPNRRSQVEAAVHEIFYFDDIMLRVAWSNSQTIEQFCITVMGADSKVLTPEGFVLGEEKFSALPFYELPLSAYHHYGNYSGYYIYEESGFAPSVAGGGYSGSFGFYGIQEVNRRNSDFWTTPAPVYGKEQTGHLSFGQLKSTPTKLKLRAISRLDAQPDLFPGEMTNGSEMSFSGSAFRISYALWRNKFGPDTYCSGGNHQFRWSFDQIEVFHPEFGIYFNGE